MDGDRELLERFKPRVLYDSLEAFFADCPAEIADLSSLQPGVARKVAIQGKRYRSRYVRLVSQNARLRDWVFGRVHPQSGEVRWLQYWFFYYYDDPALASHLGAHEGDWEMIQIRVRWTGGEWKPECAVYSQHNYASRCAWKDVDTEPGSDGPLVYSARGSHASYFAAGLYDTAAWFDVADGHVRRPELQLIVLDDATKQPSWAYWEGRWGGTEQGHGVWVVRMLARIKRAREVLMKIQSASPDAPCSHDSWKDPDAFFDKATERESLERVHRPSELPVTFERSGSRLRYELGPSGDAAAAATLVVKVGGDPTRSFTLDVRKRRRHSGTVPWLKLDPGKPYEVTSTIVGADGRSSVPVTTTIDVAPARWHTKPLAAIGYVVALAFQPIWQLQAKVRELDRLAED